MCKQKEEKMTNELSLQQAAVVKALVGRYKNHDIAALYGVNPRAVSHIKNGVCYPTVKPNYEHGFQPSEITTPKIRLIEENRRLKG